MLNLLPQEEKKKLISEYKMRFSITIVIFVGILFLIAIIGLFPSYMSKRFEMQNLLQEKQDADDRNSEASLAEAERSASFNKALVDYMETRVGVLESGPSVNMLTEKIFAKKTSAISIGSIDITGKEVTIRGVAGTRAELISFHSSLRTEPEFKNATLPISDIAKSTEAIFAIIITLP
jgi:Tfp pilus assembly protein PilN